jgi:uncharacterized protein YkuJ
MWKMQPSKYSPSIEGSKRERSIRPENTILARLHTQRSPSKEPTENTNRENPRHCQVQFKKERESFHLDQFKRHNPPQKCLQEHINLDNQVQKWHLVQYSKEGLRQSLPLELFKEDNLV